MLGPVPLQQHSAVIKLLAKMCIAFISQVIDHHTDSSHNSHNTMDPVKSGCGTYFKMQFSILF